MPLDLCYPAERIAFILADSEAAILLTQASLRNMLPEGGRGGDQDGVEVSVKRANDGAGFDDVPERRPGSAVFFRPRGTGSAFNDARFRWAEEAPERLEIVVLELNPHAMLMEPYVRLLAKEMNLQISREGRLG